MTRRREALFVWACVALTASVCAGLQLLGCAEGTAGEVCEQPAAADCPSTGPSGELGE